MNQLSLKKHILLTCAVGLTFCLGVFLHESAHYITMKYIFENTPVKMTFHAVYAMPKSTKLLKEAHEIYKRNKAQIDKGQDFPEKRHYTELNSIVSGERIWRSLSAPLSMFMLGTFAWLVLLYKRSSFQQENRYLSLWGLFLLSLFLGEAIIDCLSYSLYYFMDNPIQYRFDLATTSAWLGLPNGFLLHFAFAVPAAIMLSILFFRIIPRSECVSLIACCAVGTIMGQLFWFRLLGPWLLPDIPPSS